MSTLQQDNFVDTSGVALESHTPNTGAGWLKIFDSIIISTAGSGLVVSAAGARFAPYYTLADSSGDDQRVTLGISYGSGADIIGECTTYGMLRCQTSDANRYEGWAIITGATTMSLWIKKTVSGTTTTLVSTSITVSLPSSHTMEFSVVGTTLTLKIDGVTQLTTTDSSISGSGNRRMGLRRDDQAAKTESQQPLITSFLGEDLSAGGAALPLGLVNGGLVGNPLVNRGLVRFVR